MAPTSAKSAIDGHDPLADATATQVVYSAAHAIAVATRSRSGAIRASNRSSAATPAAPKPIP